MIVELYANKGSDASPDWKQVAGDIAIQAVGAGTTINVMKPVMRPAVGYVFPEEYWLSPLTWSAAEKIASWCKPSASSQNAKVFKYVFGADMLAAPVLSAYDNSEFNSWSDALLAGTELSEFNSLIKAYITGREISAVAPPQNWTYCETGRAGNGNPNCLCGSASFVTVPFVPKVGDEICFTMATAVPADLDYGQSGTTISLTFVHV